MGLTSSAVEKLGAATIVSPSILAALLPYAASLHFFPQRPRRGPGNRMRIMH
jgi:hypothetical protein